MTNVVYRAKLFATKAHAAVGQVRKYTNQPYIVHPIEVANIVKTVPHTDAMLAAALLHDVLEDTKVTEDELRQAFGDEITTLVLWLTDVSKPTDGVRAFRKAIDRIHSHNAPAEAQTVKVADLISNSSTITKFDPDFAKVYLEEKVLLLDVLDKADKTLKVRAYNICKEYKP